MFDSVLIANRGEVAVRIARTLRNLGIRSIGVFSDADRNARHVASTDVSIHIGPADAARSYLDVARIVEAALTSGAQALHPGYGFLSENVALAQACAAAGIVFVGPPVEAIDAMADKIRAKATVSANGVRVVPGVAGDGLSEGELIDAAGEVGLPVLIKPSAGGGGKGMRLVTDPSQLAEAIAAARRQARTAFGDDTLLIERYVERPRHIEVQVLADAYGNVVHLGERECSLQRRHQKVIEEAPSPFLDDVQRAALGSQAVAAARACGYVNAGTVEFIVSGNDASDAFFLEMNTRLQVEHPVTEMVWGIDLVEQQLKIAAGEQLAFSQTDLTPRGHAFEARVYAEDPSAGFLPTGGTVVRLREPSDRAHVRVDSSLTEGTVVASHYDPMLAKVIAWGPDRDSGRRRVRSALADTVVLGVTTNIEFLGSLLDHPDVVAGVLDTGLIERLPTVDSPAAVERSTIAATAAAIALRSGSGAGPWHDPTGWRLGGPANQLQRLLDGQGATLDVLLRSVQGAWEVTIGDTTPRRVEAEVGIDHVRLDVDGTSTRFDMARDGDVVWLGTAGATWQFTAAPLHDASGRRQGAGALTLVSPMPGRVVAVNVAAGETVAEGQAVVVVEAMKMEHTLRAPAPSRVRSIEVAAGQQVGLRQVLAVLEPPD